MAIARVASQASGATVDNSTSMTKAFPGNVTAGNLISVQVQFWSGTTNDPPVLADMAKSAGTATLGTWTLDKVYTVNLLAADYWHTAIYSAPVTGTGSCTVTLSGMPSGSYGAIGVEEYTSADTTASRVVGTNTGTGSNSPMATGTVTSTADAAFVGALISDTYSTPTITPDSPFATIYEEENGVLHSVGSFIDAIQASGVTDAASWSVSGIILDWQCILVAYKGAAAGGAGNPWYAYSQ